MDAAQWAQGLGLVKPMEEMVSSTTSAIMASATTSNNIPTGPQMMTERRGRPQKEQVVNCPRCNSTNTKFCYYNNYSLTQPRYFCKTCRRYWTEGGTLRNVPVGGGSRKNKRHPSTVAASTSLPSASNITSSVTATSSSAAEAPPTGNLNPSNKKLHVMPPQDLNLAFNHPGIGELNDLNSSNGNPSARLSAMELLRGEMAGRSIGNFIPMQLQMLHEYHHQQQQQQQQQQHQQPPIAFGMQEFRPQLGFPLDVVGGSAGNYGNLQGVQERGNGRLLFPFEELKPAVELNPSTDGTSHFEQNRGQGHEQDPPGFWQGMMGGGEGSW